MSTAQMSEWISVRAAAEYLEVPLHKMQSLVRQDAVTTLKLPNSRPKVSSADLERLKRQARRPANRPAAAEGR